MHEWVRSCRKHQFHWKPFIQSLYIDLLEDDESKPVPIHLGFKSGIKYVMQHLELLQQYGVNHVILNLKYGSRPADEVVNEIGETIIPHFS